MQWVYERMKVMIVISLALQTDDRKSVLGQERKRESVLVSAVRGLPLLQSS